jgi:hypothetical protein
VDKYKTKQLVIMESYRANNLKIYDTDNVTVRREIYPTGFENYEFDDVLPSSEWIPSGGGAAPDSVAFTIGGVAFTFKTFDGNATTETMSSTFEIIHGIDLDNLNNNTLLAEIHTHGMASTTAAGDVKIFFDLVYLPANGAPIAWGTFSTLITISANQQYYHKLSGVELPKPTSGFGIGDNVIVQYRRNPSDVQDTYGADWIFMQCALHMPFNSKGSRQRYVK